MNSEIDITEELGKNFLTYAIDVDQNKAFPSVRDGLLPGARAALWEMYSQKYTSNKPYVKSAKVASGVIGKWWPHNADATYGTLVRMAQPFVENVLEVDFQGAAGNAILGQDSYGSSRYTEMRLSKLAEQGMLQGLDKQNVDMIWNYCQDEQWPKYLPAIFPRLLVNGSVGLGVGLSQNWALHNFSETAELISNYLKTNEVDEDNYYPDYPTGGVIVNKDELPQINKTGKGRVVVEAKYRVDKKTRTIVFYEFPYQVYLEKLIGDIKDAVNAGKILSVEDIYNSSDKQSLSVTVVAEKKFSIEECVEELFSNSALRSTYNIMQNGIIDQAPEMVPLRRAIEVYVEHNLSCIKREHQYDLDKTNGRIEILEGLVKALGDIDGLIKLIKESESAAKAKEKILSYGFTERQTDAILAMKLSRLAHLEVDEVRSELAEKQALAEKLAGIVGSQEKQKEILVERLDNLAKEFGDTRRTQVIQKEIKKMSAAKAKKEKAPEDVVICLDRLGYVKVVPLGKFRTVAANAREEKTRTDRMVNFYSSLGKAYRLKASSLKMCLNSDKGTALGSILSLEQGETIVDFSVNSECTRIFFATQQGKVKVLAAKDVDGATQNKRGIPMMKLSIGDKLVSVHCMDDKSYACLTTNSHELVFSLTSIRASGKTSSGRVGIALKEDETVTLARLLDALDGDMVVGKVGQRGQEIS